MLYRGSNGQEGSGKCRFTKHGSEISECQLWRAESTSFGSVPSVSAASITPSLYLIARTEAPVTIGSVVLVLGDSLTSISGCCRLGAQGNSLQIDVTNCKRSHRDLDEHRRIGRGLYLNFGV